MAHPSIQAGGCHGVLADMAACRICSAKQFYKRLQKHWVSPNRNLATSRAAIGWIWKVLRRSRVAPGATILWAPFRARPGGPDTTRKRPNTCWNNPCLFNLSVPHPTPVTALGMLWPSCATLFVYAHVACAGNSRSLTFLCFYCDLL